MKIPSNSLIRLLNVTLKIMKLILSYVLMRFHILMILPMANTLKWWSDQDASIVVILFCRRIIRALASWVSSLSFIYIIRFVHTGGWDFLFYCIFWIIFTIFSSGNKWRSYYYGKEEVLSKKEWLRKCCQTCSF